MPGFVFIFRVYTSVRGSENFVPALIKKKKRVQGWRVWIGGGQAAKRGAVGISLAVGGEVMGRGIGDSLIPDS